MGDDQKQDKFKDLGGTFRLDINGPQVSSTEGAPAHVREPIPAPAQGLGGTFRLDTTVPQVSSTEGAPAQVRQPISAPAPSPNKIEDIREATNPDEAAKRIGEGFEGTVTGGLKMLGDIVLPPGKTEGERLKYLGKKYVTGPLNAAAAEALKQGPGIQQAATVGEALPGVGPLAVAPVVEPIKAASKSPTAALTASQNLAGQAGAITLLAPAFEGAKAGAEGVVSGLGETAQTALGAAGEEVGNMARATAPEGSTEAGRVKLNVKGKAPTVTPGTPAGVIEDASNLPGMQRNTEFKNPKDPTHVKLEGPANVELSENNGNLRIKAIEVPEESRRQGQASKLLTSLTDLADKHGVKTKLTASPYAALGETGRPGKEILDADELKSFYERHGFVQEPGSDPAYGYMIREPQPAEAAPAVPAAPAEPVITHKENVEDVPGAPMNRVVLKQGDKEMGRLNYVINGDTASVKTVGVEPPLRGKGYAQRMYKRAADEIKAAHPEVKTLTSDLQGSTNEKATGVWDSLANQGHPIEKIASTKKGSSAYSWDLTKPQGAPKPVDFSEVGGITVKPPSTLPNAEVAASANRYNGAVLPQNVEAGAPNISAIPELPADEQRIQQRQKEIEAGINPTNELPIPAAYQSLFGYPETQYARAQKGAGYTWQNVRAHEAGHAIVADAKGFAVHEMGAAEADSKGRVQSLANMTVNYGGGSNPISGSTPVPGKPGVYNIPADAMAPRIKDMLSTLMAGGVAQEEFHGIPMATNPGMAGDIETAHRFMRALDVPMEERNRYIAEATEDARSILTHPTTKGIMDAYTKAREEGTPDNLHMTSERVNQMVKEVREARNENRIQTESNPTGHDEAANRVGGEPVSRGEGTGAGGAGQTVRAESPKITSEPSEEDTSFGFGAKAAAEAAGKYHPDLQKIADKYGVKETPSGSGGSFITPDGKFIRLSGTEHPEAIRSTLGNKYESYSEPWKTIDNRIPFANETGSVQVRAHIGRDGQGISIRVPKQGVTPEQIDAIKAETKAAVGRGGRLVMERVDVTPETQNTLTKTVEYGNANNIEPMLRDIQAHPDKTAPGWHETAGAQAAKESAGGIDPRTGKSDEKGIGAEFMPEVRQNLDHAPTPKDFQDFYEKNKALFDADPSLRVGWDNNSKVPGGHEINIAATGKGAVKMARKLDQRAAFDIGKNEEIPTGGEGLQTKFPNYPVEERLNDLHDRPQSNIPKFENVPQRIYDRLTPDARKYLADDPKLQQRMMAEIHKEPLTEGEAVTAAAASSDINGWWRRFNDIHDRIGDAGPTKTNQYGVRYGDISKAFHSALSGNKFVEDANNLAWGSMYDWLKAGEPTDRASIDAIIRANGAAEAGELGPTGAPKKGNAALSDTLNSKGKVTHENLDTTELWRLVNSPEMRGEKPFSGNIWSETSPIEAKGAQARKLPSMLATTAGGDLNNAVVDAIMSRFMGKKQLPSTEAKYLADSVFLRGVGDTMKLPTGEAQEQIWTTTQAFLSHIKEGLTPEQAADKIIHEGTYSTGKDYADIILNDPEVSGKGGYLDKLKKEFGIGPGSDGIADLHRQTRAAQPPKESTAGPLNKADLTATGERIRGTLNENRIKKPTNPDLAPALKASMEGLKKPGRDFSTWSAPSPTLKAPLEGLSKPGKAKI